MIKVENLVAHYGERKVLDDVSLEVREGEIFVILGGSGSGKSTLLKHMAGLLKPTSGAIRYNGDDLLQMDEDAVANVQRSFGMAFQSGGLFNSLTVAENVALPLREYGDMDDEELVHAVVRMKLGLVGLGAAFDLRPAELSGGMQKRAGLARAIATDPPLVYFDEPSAGLDPIMASGLDELILKLRDHLGTTFVIVTHELESIRRIADRMIMLDRGKVVFEGTLKDTETADERVRQFFERRPDAFIEQRNA